jgi:uncharacterized protein YndB with AHSA1/START domain
MPMEPKVESPATHPPSRAVVGTPPVGAVPERDLPRGTAPPRHDGVVPRTDTAHREIAAPPGRVFAALVDPDALVAWLPPAGMSARFEGFDARPGGSYRMVLTYLDAADAPGKASADTDVVDVRVVQVVPEDRVVQAVDFESDDPAFAGTMTMTWRVEAVDGGTRVEIRAEDVPDGISAEDHAAGLASSLDQLAAFVER